MFKLVFEIGKASRSFEVEFRHEVTRLPNKNN